MILSCAKTDHLHRLKGKGWTERTAIKPTRLKLVEFSKCLLILVLQENRSKGFKKEIFKSHEFQPSFVLTAASRSFTPDYQWEQNKVRSEQTPPSQSSIIPSLQSWAEACFWWPAKSLHLMSAGGRRELETSQTPWDVTAKQEAVLSWGWKDKRGKGSIHMDSDKDRRRERGSRKARGTKGWTLLLPRLKQRLLQFVITKYDTLGVDGNICLLLLIRGEYTNTGGVWLWATQTWVQEKGNRK